MLYFMCPRRFRSILNAAIAFVSVMASVVFSSVYGYSVCGRAALLVVCFRLSAEHLRIFPARRYQLGVTPLFGYSPVLHENYAVSIDRGGKSVRDEYNCFPAACVVHAPIQLALGERVERGGGLIEYHGAAIAGIDTCDGETL